MCPSLSLRRLVVIVVVRRPLFVAPAGPAAGGDDDGDDDGGHDDSPSGCHCFRHCRRHRRLFDDVCSVDRDGDVDTGARLRHRLRHHRAGRWGHGGSSSELSPSLR